MALTTIPFYATPSTASTLATSLQPRQSAWQQVNQFIGSPLGQALFSGVGAALQYASQNRLARDQMAQNAMLTREGLLASALRDQADDKRLRDFFAAQARPIGEAQEYLQRQALRSALFDRVFGSGAGQRLMPANPAIRAAMGSAVQSPKPADPLLRAIFAPENVLRGAASAIAQRDMDILSANPYASVTDLEALGLSNEDADRRAQHAEASAASLEAERARAASLLQQAIDGQQNMGRTKDGELVPLGPNGEAPEGYEFDKKTGLLKKKGSSWWKKALGIVGNIGLAVATGGMSIPAQIAIQAGAGAAQGALSGGGLRGALTGAALGAGTAGAMGALGAARGAAPAAGQSIGRQIASNLTNPTAWRNATINYGIASAPSLLGAAIAGGGSAPVRSPYALPNYGPMPGVTPMFAPQPLDAQRFRRGA